MAGAGLLAVACAPGGASSESSSASNEASGASEAGETSEVGEESGEESGDTGQVFDPLVCGSWPEAEAPPPEPLPPEAPCDDPQSCLRFVDVTVAAGITHTQYIPVSGARSECIFDLASGETVLPNADCEPQWFTGGAAVADVDGDDWPDLFVTRLGAPDRLYINRGDGRFDEESEARGLGACTFSNGAIFGDIDDDGDPDLLVASLGGERHFLYLNDGTGHFSEAAEAWDFDLSSPTPHAGQSIALGDYDLDGRLDAYIGAWIEPHNQPDFAAPGPHGARLLHNEGDRFTDRSESAGIDLLAANPEGIYAFAASFVDLDADDWPELTIAGDFRTARLFWNSGDGSFVDGSEAAGINEASNPMGSAFGDWNADGRLDWFVTSIGERDAICPDTCPWKSSGNRLYVNQGDRTFTVAQDQAGVRDAGWGWGTTFFDMDNDGDLDLFAVNGWPGRDLNGGLVHREFPARLWRNRGDGVMDEVAAELGADDMGQGRAVIAFDYDRDGDLDLFIANHAQAPTLLRNDGGNANAWLEVELEGVVSNRDARGAVLELRDTVGNVIQRRQVGASSHFLAEGPLIEHFGLGAVPSNTLELWVRWPASDSESLIPVDSVNTRLRVVEAP